MARVRVRQVLNAHVYFQPRQVATSRVKPLEYFNKLRS